MIVLTTNIANTVARICMAILILVIFYLVIVIKIIPDQRSGDSSVFFFYLYLLLLGFIFSACIKLLCFSILKVTIDPSSNLITFKKMFTKFTLSLSDISGYYTTIYTTSVKTFNGLIIQTLSGKSFKLMQQNLNSIPELKKYLSENGISCFGDKSVRNS